MGYTATCKCLSDKNTFPSFLRTVPSDNSQSRAMAHLVNHFGWIFIGTVEDYDEYGKQGINQFLVEAEDKDLCIAFREILPRPENKENVRLITEVILAI